MATKVARLQITRSIEQGDLNPVGMIVQSMLTEAQFQALNGTSWVLADGRSVAGSSYATVTGSANVPDARGLFLRAKNNSRSDGNQDPSGERSLGNLQGTAVPNITGAMNGIQSDIRSALYASGAFTATAVYTNGNTTAGGADGCDTNFDASRSSSVYQSVTEARPRNLAVNVFIKIN